MKIIKIGAMWCPGCLVMHKIWGTIETEFPDVEIISYDLDMDPDEVAPYNVGTTLPVIVFLNDGKEVSRLIGEKKYEDIKEKILEISEAA